MAICPPVVAPRVGAWIEIQEAKAAFEEGLVAPRVGAWIEIGMTGYLVRLLRVAPRVGAWIEMTDAIRELYRSKSRPAWARGLKYLCAGAAL